MDDIPPPPPVTNEPQLVKIDPSCLHAALKEFFQPLRTNDTRADFFTVYRRESEEFDRDYARKYDGDLNTSLIFAGLFSAVCSAFIIDVQSKLEPDPNEMNAAYMRVLIHAVDGSLYPDADPLAPVTWNGPAPEIVTVQCLLYTSLATSLFAAFVAMLGKQWVNRYIRNRGGSATEKSWDRQQKLDGMGRWYFHVVMEGLPVMLQIALALLGCALSQYLWTINRAVAGVIIAVTSFGFGFHFVVTIAAAISYDCPFQTPPSIAIRALASYVSRSYPSLTPSLRSFVSRVLYMICLPATWTLSLLRLLLASILKGLMRTSTAQTHITPEIPLAVVAEPTRIFDDAHIDWVSHGADARCVAWVLYSTTDYDVILSSVHFAADIIWYPRIAGALSPYVLAELFFGCFMDKQIIPGKTEQARAIAMALASVLNAQLCLEPENKDLRQLCGRIVVSIDGLPGNNEGILSLVMWALDLVARPPDPSSKLPSVVIPATTYQITSRETAGAGFITFKLWMARVLLQTMWRWRRSCDLNTIICLPKANFVIRALFHSTDPAPTAFKSNVTLALAIGLGLRVDAYDTYIPDTLSGLTTVCDLLHNRLMSAILSANKDPLSLRLVLCTLFYVGLQDLQDFRPYCFEWLDAILDSDYPDADKYELAGLTLLFLHEKAKEMWNGDRTKLEFPRYATVLARFLLLHEKCRREGIEPKNNRGWEFDPLVVSRAHPATIALQILLGTPKHTLILPIFLVIIPALQYDQWRNTRAVALKLFNRHRHWLFSPMIENLLPTHRAELLRAIGDPFDLYASTHLAILDRTRSGETEDARLSAKVTALLLALTSSDMWRDHLHPTNFASCDAIMAEDEHLPNTITYFSNWSSALKGPGGNNFSGLMVGINRLKRLRCHSAVKLILLSLWSRPITPLYDQEVWRWVERQTLELFSTRSEEHLGLFVSQIKKVYGKAMVNLVTQLKRSGGENGLPDVGSPSRVDRVGGSVWTMDPKDPELWDWESRFYTMCQLRRLYRLLGHDPTSVHIAAATGEGVPPPPPIDTGLPIDRNRDQASEE